VCLSIAWRAAKQASVAGVSDASLIMNAIITRVLAFACISSRDLLHAHRDGSTLLARDHKINDGWWTENRRPGYVVLMKLLLPHSNGYHGVNKDCSAQAAVREKALQSLAEDSTA
jgi:hypothetical protein